MSKIESIIEISSGLIKANINPKIVKPLFEKITMSFIYNQNQLNLLIVIELDIPYNESNNYIHTMTEFNIKPILLIKEYFNDKYIGNIDETLSIDDSNMNKILESITKARENTLLLVQDELKDILIHQLYFNQIFTKEQFIIYESEKRLIKKAIYE